MLVQLYYFKFTRNVLLSKISLCYKPSALLKLSAVYFKISTKQQIAFKSSIFASSLLLFITGEYPQFCMVQKSFLRLSYNKTLRKNSLCNFFLRLTNLALVHNLRFLKVFLEKSKSSLSQNILFNVINPQLFPEFFILLGTTQIIFSLQRIFSFLILLKFTRISTLLYKINLLHSLQFPLLYLIASN
jgi:hypothetical protein